VAGIRNLPENCTYSSISCALLNSNSEPIQDLGILYPDLNCDSMNPRFKGKIKISQDVVKEQSCYFYGEIKTFDDSMKELPCVTFGCFLIELGEKDFSKEIPIHFETFGDDIVD
jgi:hypothetical protein